MPSLTLGFGARGFCFRRAGRAGRLRGRWRRCRGGLLHVLFMFRRRRSSARVRRPLSACATPLRDAAPFRRGFDRPRPARRPVGAAVADARRLGACFGRLQSGRCRWAIARRQRRDRRPGGAWAARSSASALKTSRCGRGGGSACGGGAIICSSGIGSIRGARRGGIEGGIADGIGIGGGGAGGSGCSGQEPFDAASGNEPRAIMYLPAPARAVWPARAMPALRARYLIRRRRRSVRRSSPDARHCRGAPAKAAGARRRWRIRSPPAAADVRAPRRRAARCRTGAPPRRRRRSIRVRSGMPRRNARRVAFPRRTNRTFAQLPRLVAAAALIPKG